MRMPRIDVTETPYHVCARGNNKGVIFNEDENRLVYLGLLRGARKRFDYILYSYALMDNHIHLLLEMRSDTKLAHLIHWIHLAYAQYVNRRNRATGHVFESRYFSNIVETDRYFLAVDRYIHLNPVKAGIVQKPEDYRWSSYASRFNGKNSEWVQHQTLLDYFGRDAHEQYRRYQQFTEEDIGKPEPWSHKQLERTHCLGSAEFLRRVKEKSNLAQRRNVVL